MSGKRKRNAYDTAFKLRVVDYAESHNNCAAEREFGVTEKMVRDWRKKKSELLGASKSVKKIRHNPSPYAELEKDLNNWVLERREEGCIITRTNIRMRALQLSNDTKYNISNFKASAGWCTRFMNRFNLTLRQKTHIAQKLPSDLDEKVEKFHKFVMNERKLYDYPLISIGNMDETPMTFDMPGNRTVNVKGAKTVTVRTCGAEKSHFTVVLACLADGTKLKPMTVFKRKTMPKEKLPPGVLVKVHPKGWMDEQLVNEWLKEIWFKRPGSLIDKRSILVWDMFRAHLVDSVKKNLRRNKTRQAVIPGGTTSVLQPLDVCLNKPFKCNMRKLWNLWMIEGTKELTPAGNLRRPSIPLVCEWVVKAWQDIPTDMVIRSFKKCGISNNMDGSEDDELYSDLIQTSDQPVSEPIDDVEEISDDVYDDIYDDVPLSEIQFAAMFEEDSLDEFVGFEPQDNRE